MMSFTKTSCTRDADCLYGRTLETLQKALTSEFEVWQMTKPKPGPYKFSGVRMITRSSILFITRNRGNTVLYRAEYGERQLWVRPLEMFVESVEINGQEVPRFRYVGD